MLRDRQGDLRGGLGSRSSSNHQGHDRHHQAAPQHDKTHVLSSTCTDVLGEMRLTYYKFLGYPNKESQVNKFQKHVGPNKVRPLPVYRNARGSRWPWPLPGEGGVSRILWSR